jgi:integrase/recombinase XerC
MKTPQIFDEFGHLVSTTTDARPIDDVIDEFVATKRSQNTRRAYTRDVANAFDYLGVTELQQLGQIQFYDLVASLTQHLELATDYDDETKRAENPKTVNRKAYAISAFFKFLSHSYGYPKNPLENYQAHKIQKRSNTPSLTAAQVIDVIAYFEKDHKKSQTKFRNYLAICSLAVLALRRNELVGLKWSDINFEDTTANVFQKGGGYKLLPIAPKLLKKLQEYKDTYPTVDYIFSPVRNPVTGNLNKPLNTNYIYDLVSKSVFKVTKGKKATPHSFRKSFIEIALNNQEDFISIINATGHTTVEMVKYYDTRDTLKHNAVHGMAKLI